MRGIFLGCKSCGTGLGGSISALRQHIRKGNWFCSQCGVSTPVEKSYLDEIKLPAHNSLFLSNYSELGEVKVKVGLTHSVKLKEEVDEIVWLTATSNANFSVFCDVVHHDKGGFTISTSFTNDRDFSSKKDPVIVTWAVDGFKGESPLFLKLLRGAFRLLWQVHSWKRDYRIILIEGITAFEVFLSWYLREHVFTDNYYKVSSKRQAKITEFIRSEGIHSITDVVFRSAIRDIDIYHIFKLLRLPVNGKLFNTDLFVDRILTGITIRNKVVHKGIINIEKNTVEESLSSIYFLIEAILFHCLDNEQILKLLKSSSL